MNLRLYRGQLLLKLSIVLDRWAWRAMHQAKKDFGRSVRPEGDLFDQDNPSHWGGR